MNNFVVRYGRTVVYFGLEAVKNMSGFVENYRQVYIVTSRSAASRSGALKDVLQVLDLKGVGYDVFSGVSPNPMYDIVEQIADEVRKGYDAVIAIGGGSVIDAAKIASAISVCGGRVKDYVLGGKSICGSRPLLAINLTHGTGSEVDRYAVVTLDNPRTKFGMASDYFYSMASFDDPRYTLTMPYEQVIYTSLDAFYHAYEAATGKDTSPYVVMLSEEVVKIITQWLPVAVKDPSNLEARYWLLYASMLAGIAIDNSRAHIIHVIENVLSGINTNLPHGAGLGMLGPQAAIYIHRAVPELSYRMLRHLNPNIRPVIDDAEKALKTIAEFQRSIGFDEGLEDYGFSEVDAEAVADTVVNFMGYGLRLAPFTVDKDTVKEIFVNALRSR